MKLNYVIVLVQFYPWYNLAYSFVLYLLSYTYHTPEQRKKQTVPRVKIKPATYCIVTYLHAQIHVQNTFSSNKFLCSWYSSQLHSWIKSPPTSSRLPTIFNTRNISDNYCSKEQQGQTPSVRHLLIIVWYSGQLT